MRYVWLAFLVLLLGMLTFVGWRNLHSPPSPDAEVTTALAPSRPVSITAPAPGEPELAASSVYALPHADSLIRFAMQQLGSPYTYAGTTPTGGFDCSGFLLYVYGHFGIPVPHSTALLIDTGLPVAREQARRGDMVIFTGTAATSTTPGHAGIVISEPGEPIRFIHASSARRESGVKISQVEGTDYERRFLGIRRVLGVVSSGAVARKGPPARTAVPTPALVLKTPAVGSTLVVPAPKVRRVPLAPSHSKHKAVHAAPAKRKVKAKTTSARAAAARPSRKKKVATKTAARKR